jgi:anaerobic ribonucleoside-triphosphate reductase activating protein
MKKIKNITWYLHATVPVSKVNGPGKRFVIWVQGCSLDCPGCFNPQSHPQQKGYQTTPEYVLNQIQNIQDSIEGITISGGEPFQQILPLEKICRLVKQNTSLGVILFTGYSKPELERMPKYSSIFPNTDLIISGRFMLNQRIAQGLIGSANKEFIFNGTRYHKSQFENIPESEVLIQADGEIKISGINPIQWK